MHQEESGSRLSPGESLKARLFHMVSVGVVGEPLNQAYDVVSTAALILNLAAAILRTFSEIESRWGTVLAAVEAVTVLFFAVDYALRLFTAECLYPGLSRPRARLRYATSFAGLIDLLSFLPALLPFFFPEGAVAFRLFRMARVLRLFRINAYYDSLNVITEVLERKRQTLLSSVFLILVLMLGSSLCMYSLEHEAQPGVFRNAFSGIWWAASTLLTVGYGDIYPVTTAGKIFGTFIAFLGVGMVAIPTGIISAGFIEEYTRLKSYGEDLAQEDGRMELRLKEGIAFASFLKACAACRGEVIFTTDESDVLNLKSELSRYVFAALTPDMDFARHGRVLLQRPEDAPLLDEYCMPVIPDHS